MISIFQKHSQQLKTSATIFSILSLFLLSCRVHKQELKIQTMSVNFLGGNNYQGASNTGNFKIQIEPQDTTQYSLKMAHSLEMYSPLKKPILVSFSKKNKEAFITDMAGHNFNFGQIEKSDCNYDCSLSLNKTDKIYLSSSLGALPYYHGFSTLGGLPLFMRYHYYTLKIKKATGETLVLQWKYSVYKYKPFGGKSKVWSGDYCEDNGGGLTKLKIK